MEKYTNFVSRLHFDYWKDGKIQYKVDSTLDRIKSLGLDIFKALTFETSFYLIENKVIEIFLLYNSHWLVSPNAKSAN